MTTLTLEEVVVAAVSSVDDPEFPGVSIADLGILESVRVDTHSAAVEVDLVPTFLGCPALEVIASDVTAAVDVLDGVDEVSVRFLSDPQWGIERISERGRRLLADEYTVAVPGSEGDVHCPVCSSGSVELRSAFGPTACRAIGYCPSCLNPLEVMRR